MRFSPNGTECCSHGREPVDLNRESRSVPKGRHESWGKDSCRPFGTEKLLFGTFHGLTPVATTFRHSVAEPQLDLMRDGNNKRALFSNEILHGVALQGLDICWPRISGAMPQAVIWPGLWPFDHG